MGGAAAAAATRGGGVLTAAAARGRGRGRRPIQTIKLKTLKRPQAMDIISVFNQRTESLEDKKLLAKQFGLEPLLELATHDHISIKGYGEKILYAMKHDEGEIVVEDFSPIAEALRVKNMAAQTDGIWTLAVFAGLSDKNHSGILLDVGWQAIIARAKANQPQLRLGSVTLIANLSSSEDSQDIIMKEGGIELLRDLLREVQDPDVSVPLKRAVLNAFANLTANDQWRDQIVDSEFLDIVTAMVGDPDDEVKGAAVHILANITEREEYRKECAQRGLVDALLPLLRSTNEVVLSGVTKFFAQMCENPEVAEQAVDAGLPDWLARLASRSDSAQVHLNVIRCADVLAELGFGEDLKGVDLDTFIRRLMETSEDEEVRNAARNFLETIGAPNLPPRPRSNAALAKEQERLRAEAEAAEAERRAQEERERIEREEREAAERYRLEQEQLAREAEEAKRLERERLERERVNNAPIRKKPPVDREALARAEKEALERARLEHEARIKGQFISGK